MLLGALGLMIPWFGGFESNVTLAISLVVLLAGVVVHVIVQRKVMEKDSKETVKPADSENKA